MEWPKPPIPAAESEIRPAENTDEKSPREKTPRRLMFMLEKLAQLQVGKIDVRGKENISKIPKDKKVIIATSHISDVDLPLVAYVLGNDFNIAITDQSVHHSIKEEWHTYLAVKATGEKSFIPLDVYKDETGKKHSKFNPENFEPMQTALSDGKSLVIAAHNPSYEGELEKGGYGAVYLAGLDPDTVILPVAVNLKSKKSISAKNPLQAFVEKPDAEVAIGEPIVIGDIPNLQIIKSVMAKRKNKESVSSEERQEFFKVTKILDGESNKLMQRLSTMTPEEKRGIYK
jgi:1-acyl-sn-glycerol-3-phosphate acyltransferase